LSSGSKQTHHACAKTLLPSIDDTTLEKRIKKRFSSMFYVQI
jgi:hypothetical protein